MNYQISLIDYRPIHSSKKLLMLLKDHWCNGVKMYNPQHQANSDCYVFATNGQQCLPNFDDLNLSPNSVWLYNDPWWNYTSDDYKREDSRSRFDFIAEYGTFMRLTSFWKCMHLYKDTDFDTEYYTKGNSRLFLKICVHANIKLEHFK